MTEGVYLIFWLATTMFLQNIVKWYFSLQESQYARVTHFFPFLPSTWTIANGSQTFFSMTELINKDFTSTLGAGFCSGLGDSF